MRRLAIVVVSGAVAVAVGGWAQQDVSSHVPPPSAETSPLKLRDADAPPRSDRALPAPAIAAPRAPDAPAIPDRPARWTRRPADGDFTAFYPARASRQRVEGRAVVSCVVGVDQVPRDCVVESESPAGYGFGEAASSIARRARLAPPVRGGQVRETRIRIPFVFNQPELAPPTAKVRVAPPAAETTGDASVDEFRRFQEEARLGQRGAVSPPKPKVHRPPLDLSWVAPYLLATVGGALGFVLLMTAGLWAMDRRNGRAA